MTTLERYARLQRLGSPLITTGEAAAALRVSTSAASRSLRRLAQAGMAERIRYGLWRLTSEPVDPRRLASAITRPYPAYVSFESALSAHGMLDQLPRDISLASLDRAKKVRTSLGTYAVHHLPPELFGGFTDADGIPLATPEKALFDYLYVSHASANQRRRLPEIELPAGFSRAVLRRWVRSIRSAALRRRVRTALDTLVDGTDGH